MRKCQNDENWPPSSDTPQVPKTHISNENQPFLKIKSVLDISDMEFLEETQIPFLTSPLQPQSIPDNFSLKTVQAFKK